jgi:hypothetical protein
MLQAHQNESLPVLTDTGILAQNDFRETKKAINGGLSGC